MQVSKSNKLANVCYDIRGPVLKHAKRLEEEGQRILKLNIGNPAPFGFEAPDEILHGDGIPKMNDPGKVSTLALGNSALANTARLQESV